MKKPTLPLVLCVAAIACSALIFRAAHPKVVLVNLASTSYEEVVIQLPSSRVSFRPISAESTQVIYFSKQDSGGVVAYSLRSGGKEIAHDTLPYEVDGQFFREIRLVISKDGVLSATISG